MARKRKQTADAKKRRLAARRKQETLEQRALRLEKCRVRAAIKRANETEEDRATRLARDRSRIYSARYTLKKKARAVNLQYVLNQTSLNCSDKSNPPSMSKKEKASYRAFVILETQRAAAARSAADRRNRETFEQRRTRLEKCRIRSAVSRACEDEETRAVRLARQRIRSSSARLKQRLTELEPQQANQQRTSNNNSLYNHKKTLVKSLKQNPNSNYPAETVEEFRNNLLIHQLYQLQLAYNCNALLGLQETVNQSQLACNPSNIWPRIDDLGPVLEKSIVQPLISPIKEEAKRIDEESELEYDSSMSDVAVECEVTIEEENIFMMNELFIKGEPAEEKSQNLGCEPNREENNSKMNQLCIKGEPAEEENSSVDCDLIKINELNSYS